MVWSPLEWLVLVEHELLLFAAVFFLIGAVDELAVDLWWIWLKLSGRAATGSVDSSEPGTGPLSGPVAVFIPAWGEAAVIGFTVGNALSSWKHEDLTLFVGCYRNDPETLEEVRRGGGGDTRLRAIIHERDGPTTKADCLNSLYAALEEEERRTGREVRMIVLHDAEDMVDPAALAVLDRAMREAEFVQLPVLPEAHEKSRWIGRHYCDEFAEDHGKTMVVREALAAAVPSAGVGCAVARSVLRDMAAGGEGPFSVESLTEDYELGLRIKAAGGRTRFVRTRDANGRLVATRSLFPGRIDAAVRQKGRWIHGIALQGWDRLGWAGGLGEFWMRLRDRRGPLTALVLLTGYVLLILAAGLWIASLFGISRPSQPDPLLGLLLIANFASLVWRAGMRYAFTAREYGWREGLRAVPRIFVSNIIAIMAGRRAVFAYVRTLLGEKPRWEKTVHEAHPAAKATQWSFQ